MQQIIYFFQKFKYFLFYILLALIALALTFNNLNFHKSKYVNSANSITGGLYSKSSNISEYFSLKSENELLSVENTRLRNQLQQLTSIQDSIVEKVIVDTTNFQQKYSYINSKIIKNDFTSTFNFITINRGLNNGVKHEMAVINGKGIIGITDNSKNNYARVQSILNKNSKINARLKNSFYFGTLTWDGNDYKTVQLLDIPRQAPIKVGDTIETGGKSTIFPEGVPIGTVAKINKGNTADNKIDIKLFNDMSNLGYVYVVKSLDKIEIESLENLVDE